MVSCPTDIFSEQYKQGHYGVRRILILFAHPVLEKSRVNRRLNNGIGELSGVTFRDLYEIYPELDIDPPAEQALLERHDIVLLQFPLFLYGVPSLLKEWMDLVLVHGWAFGSRGNALKGKWFGCVMTTGGSRESYSAEGFNRYTIRQLISPLEQVACLCKMNFLPPWVIHGTNSIRPDQILREKDRYFAMLSRLSDGSFDPGSLAGLEYLNNFDVTEA